MSRAIEKNFMMNTLSQAACIYATVKPGEDKKFKPRYRGPYRVSKILNKNRYVIQDILGFNITNKPYNSILSPDRLKP